MHFEKGLKSLPNNKTFGRSKFKAATVDNLDIAKMIILVFNPIP